MKITKKDNNLNNLFKSDVENYEFFYYEICKFISQLDLDNFELNKLMFEIQTSNTREDINNIVYKLLKKSTVNELDFVNNEELNLLKNIESLVVINPDLVNKVLLDIVIKLYINKYGNAEDLKFDSLYLESLKQYNLQLRKRK